MVEICSEMPICHSPGVQVINFDKAVYLLVCNALFWQPVYSMKGIKVCFNFNFCSMVKLMLKSLIEGHVIQQLS